MYLAAHSWVAGHADLGMWSVFGSCNSSVAAGCVGVEMPEGRPPTGPVVTCDFDAGPGVAVVADLQTTAAGAAIGDCCACSTFDCALVKAAMHL